MKLIMFFENQSKFILIANILDKVFYFIFFVVLSRLLDIEHFGLIITYSAVIAIFFQFVEFGFNFYIQRSISRNESWGDEFVNIFYFRILIASLVFLFPLLYFFGKDLEIQFFIIAFTFTNYLLFLSELVTRYYFGKSNFKGFFRYFLSGTIPKYILLMFLLLGFLSLVQFQIIFAFLYLIILIKEILFIKKRDNLLFNLSLSVKKLRRVLKISLVMSTGIIAVTLYDKLDVIFLEKLVNAKSVAIYGVSYSLYKIPQMFFNSLLTPIFSIFSNEFHFKGNLKVSLVNQIIKYFILVSILYFLFILFLGKGLIVLLWGTAFVDSFLVLLILCFSIPFVLLNNLTGIILNSTNREKLATLAALFSAILGIIIYPILIYFGELLGAVLSTIIIEMSVFLIQLKFIIDQKILKLDEILFFKTLCKTKQY